MKLRSACVAAGMFALPVLAQAQPVTGPYVSLGAGTSFLQGTKFTDQATTGTGTALFKDSYAGEVAVGYGLGNGVRFEINANYLRNTGDKLDFSAAGQSPAYGGSNSYGAMFNILYDFDLGLPVYPYIGAGAGIELESFRSVLKDDFGDSISGDRGTAAYDLIAGVSLPVRAIPNLSVTLSYTFMEQMQSRGYHLTTIGAPPGSVQLGADFDHTALIGLRYALFTPPAPPPPTPMAAPEPMAAPAAAPRTYLVFFDWDKYNLTPRAMDIISEAATASKTGTTELDVSGYTDTSGTPTYNQGLSLRRAKAVEAQLVTDGVPMSEIDIHAYGETHLLVPTGPGVREPQNRRVEIVLK
jgi:opacity protein-like surface antigen